MVAGFVNLGAMNDDGSKFDVVAFLYEQCSKRAKLGDEELVERLFGKISDGKLDVAVEILLKSSVSTAVEKLLRLMPIVIERLSLEDTREILFIFATRGGVKLVKEQVVQINKFFAKLAQAERECFKSCVTECYKTDEAFLEMVLQRAVKRKQLNKNGEFGKAMFIQSMRSSCRKASKQVLRGFLSDLVYGAKALLEKNPKKVRELCNIIVSSDRDIHRKTVEMFAEYFKTFGPEHVQAISEEFFKVKEDGECKK